MIYGFWYQLDVGYV